MNIIAELNAGKKLRRKGWLEHKGQQSLYIAKSHIQYPNTDAVLMWTNDERWPQHAAIARDGDYWGVEWKTAYYEILANDWEIIE